MITDNEEIENAIYQNGSREVISIYKPKRQFIEPAALLLFAGRTLYETVLPNMVESQYCQVALNLTEAQCFSPTIDIKAKEEYEKFASSFQLYRSIIEVIIPTIISFFIGPWSDTYGRKPLILSVLIGYSVTLGLYTLASSIRTLHPLYLLFFSFPLAFSGGTMMFVLGTFCYVCDVTTVEKRAARLGRLQAVIFAGSLAGTLSCPRLLPLGYTAVYGFALATVYLSLFYIYFFLDESIVPSQLELNSSKRNPFHLNHLWELYECCYTKQTPKLRLTIFLLIILLLFSQMNSFGELELIYLFLQQVLNWDLTTFTTLKSFMIAMNAIGSYASTWFLCYKLQLNDLLVLSIEAFFRILSALVMIFGYRVWHIYFARLLSCMLGITGSMIRSFLSRKVAKDELGKVFSLLASSESATPLFATILYSSVFNLTVSTFPVAIFFLSSFLILLMLLYLCILVNMYIPDSTSLNSRHSQVVSQNIPNINTD